MPTSCAHASTTRTVSRNYAERVRGRATQPVPEEFRNKCGAKMHKNCFECAFKRNTGSPDTLLLCSVKLELRNAVQKCLLLPGSLLMRSTISKHMC